MQDWEISFSKFVDSDCKEYDRAYDALLSLACKAFKEGWIAAGGTSSKDSKANQIWCSECGSARNDSADS